MRLRWVIVVAIVVVAVGWLWRSTRPAPPREPTVSARPTTSLPRSATLHDSPPRRAPAPRAHAFDGRQHHTADPAARSPRQ